MANVIPFDTTKRLAAHAERFEQQRQELEEAGNHAWGNLKKARRKLNAHDRREIAKAMHQILEELKQQRPNLSIGKLAMDAGLSADANSKELYRLTLPPGEDPLKRGLRADAQKYVRLLKAIQRHTGENMAQLAERVTWATSLHPKQALGAEESEHIVNTLQEAINRIDLGFKEANGGVSLFDAFKETARIKTDIAEQAGKLKLRRPRWPYYDTDADDYHIEEVYPEFGPGGVIPNMPQDFFPRSDDDFDIQYAFWQRDYYYANKYSRLSARGAYSSEVAHHDALMNLPRIYLGVVDSDTYFIETAAEEDAWRRYSETHTVHQFEAEPGSRQRKIESLKSHVGELGEIRDPKTGYARIAHRHPKTGEWMPGLSREYDGEYHWVDECAHVWLVIYPSPDNTTLLPVLYQPMEEGGTLLTPINQRSLASLREMPFVDAGEPRSLYDRIKELMRASSDRSIYKAWQETAKDVLSNPVLRAYRENLAKQDDFEREMAAFWDSK